MQGLIAGLLGCLVMGSTGAWAYTWRCPDASHLVFSDVGSAGKVTLYELSPSISSIPAAPKSLVAKPAFRFRDYSGGDVKPTIRNGRFREWYWILDCRYTISTTDPSGSVVLLEKSLVFERRG